MLNCKHSVLSVLGRLALALVLAVAVSLPNYARALEADRLFGEELSRLYDAALSDFGAQEAHAVAPLLALPAAVAAAGITPEMAGAACLAIFTAVTAISVTDVWDKMPTDQKARYDGSLWNFGLAMGMLNGNYTLNPENPNQPPEPKGPGGEKMNKAIIALCTGAGLVALKDLADAAGYLIDFATSPAGEDANGYPTGLGVVSTGYTLPYSDSDFSCVLDLVDFSSWLSSVGIPEPSAELGFDGAVIPAYVSNSSDYYYLYCFAPSPVPILSKLSINSVTVKPSSGGLAKQTFIYDKKKKYWNTYGRSSSSISTTGIAFNNVTWFNFPWSDRVSVFDLTGQAANAPDAYTGVLQEVAQAGPGTEVATSIVQNFVTNNIANSDKVVTVPQDVQDTSDYDKVVVDGSTDPDPGPGPGPDPGGETSKDKAEKFLKLPVQQLFPFCLVYDIQLLIEHVAGGVPVGLADDLVFEFEMGFGYFDAPLVIDLSGYRDLQNSFHMAFDVMLVVGLLYFSISLFLKARSD